jgi:glutathione S-transferase
MPVRSDASAEITAFRTVPNFAKGLVRDLRVRWALEEAGLEYRVRPLDRRPSEYLLEQPFNQVPAFRDGEVQLFESGAIVQYIGESSEALLPADAKGRYRAIQWTYAALNSVEPAVAGLATIDLIHPDQQWAKLRRPGAEELVRQKLKCLSDWLGEKEWLEGRFTIGDLMMVTVLRILRHTRLVSEFPNLTAFVKRGQERPAFQRALADQLALFEHDQAEGEAA